MKWEPWYDIERLIEQNMPSFPHFGWDLAADVSEDGQSVTVEMNIPGADARDLQVNVQEDYVRINGKREEQAEQKKKNYYSREIKRGEFERTLKLPSSVDPASAKAEFSNGQLRVTAAKLPARRHGGNVKVEIRQ